MKDNYNLLMAKKTEKLVTAIYLISQFLPNEESLKLEVRTSANDLLRQINNIAYEDEGKNIFVLYKKCLDNVSLIISLFSIARDTNLISKMNVDIVIEGLRMLENILIKKQFNFGRESLHINEENTLLNFLEEREEGKKINFNTSFDALTERNKKLEQEREVENNIKNIFKDLKIKETKEKESIKDIYLHKGQNVKDIKNIHTQITTKVAPEQKPEQRREVKSISNKKPVLQTKTLKNQGRKNNRREQILSLFTKGTEVSINDISKKIIGCSVKTIQRELNDLLTEKKIRRIGEKRWSKYILA